MKQIADLTAEELAALSDEELAKMVDAETPVDPKAEEWLARQTQKFEKGLRPWARKFAACIVCNRTDSRHSGRGLCHACRQAARTGVSAAYRAAQRAQH